MRLSSKLYYGFGSVAYGVKDQGFAYLLLIYYNQVLGLPEVWVGTGIMIALVFDAISDPIVGYASDHLHSRWGRRHPFMYAAVLPVAISYYLLFNPPAGLQGASLFLYFVVVAILVRTFITFYEIPSTSLVAELTDDYDERTSLLSFRFFFGWWGGLTMGVLAFAFLLRPAEGTEVGVLNPEGYQIYGIVAAALMVFAILVSALGTHRHIPDLKPPPAGAGRGFRHTLRELRETFANRSFQVLFVAGLCFAMAAGVSSALNVYFATFFWELQSSEIAMIVVANFPAAAVALLAAPRVSKRLGKKHAALWLGTIALVFAPVTVVGRLLEIMPSNESVRLLPILVGHSALEVSLVITVSILLSAMVADVVEDSEVKTGRRSEGMFFAARSFMQKCVSGAGVFASTVILGLIGFPQDAQPGEVAPAVVRRLGIVYAPLLVVLYGMGLAIVTGYGISRESHEHNLRTLEAGTST